MTKKGRSIRGWNDGCDESFMELQQALISAPILAYPTFDLAYKWHSYASQFAIGGTFKQIVDGKEIDVSYFEESSMMDR